MKSAIISLVHLLLVTGILGVAMWLGYLVQTDIPLTLLVLLITALVVGFVIYGDNFTILYMHRLIGGAYLIETLVIIVDVAKVARKNVLAIEDALPSIANEYLRHGLRLVVDRVDRFLIQDINDTYRNSANRQEEQWLNQWKSLSHLVLLLGLLLSGYQFVRAPNLDLEGYQLYPLLLGGLIWIALFYFSYVMKGLLENRILHREMVAFGVLLIEKNERPEFIEQMLMGYFSPNRFKTYERLKLAHLEKRKKETKQGGIKAEDTLADSYSLESIPAGALREIEAVLANEDSKDSITPSTVKAIEKILVQEIEASRFDGVKVMADILNQMGKAAQSSILETIEKTNADLARQIRELMSAFENLVRVDALGTQAILKETPQDPLVMSLKIASDELKNHIFQNMSKRAADMVRDDMDALGSVHVANVFVAQQKIVKIARRLEAEGKISLGGGGEAK